MAEERQLKKDETVVLAAEGQRRDALGKALRAEGFKPHFVGTLDTITDLLASTAAASFLHDWPTVDLTQGIAFHQRLGKISSSANLCRVLYVDNVSAAIAAMAADTGIKRVVSHAKNPPALATEIKMALVSVAGMSDLQRQINEIQAGANYSQDQVDSTIEKAYKSYGHDPAVRLEYGNLCLRRKFLQNAKTIAEALIGESAVNVRAINLLSRVLMQEGQTDLAIATLEQANVLSPMNFDRLVLLGDAFFSVGQKDKAGAYYQQALTTGAPDPKPAKRGIAQVKLSEGDINAALEIIKGSLSEEEAAALFNNAAIRAAHAGQSETSLALYQSALKALKTNKLKAAVHFNIALAYERLGRYDDAAKQVTRSLKLDPEFDKAKRHQARLVKKMLQRGA